ncbi:hypothetical protein [Gordonia shandongensis]|uniref:hypothetical protein n=1 Tax=Gordonia shandongensis TaxID=376351 RepID=UPI00047A3FDF|nr:hypothetical protein [Gordonia shandongensis]
MTVRLDPSGFLQVVPGPPPPTPPPRQPGDIILPEASRLEQEIVWVFPHLATAPITPAALRRTAHASWDWAVGAACHRAIIDHVPLASNWNSHATKARTSINKDLVELTVNQPHPPVSRLAAQLEQRIDIFGPSDLAHFQAINWILFTEFQLAQSKNTLSTTTDTHERARYESLESLIALDQPYLSHRAKDMADFYFSHAFDIKATWLGEPTLQQRDRSRQIQERTAKVKRMYRTYRSNRNEAALNSEKARQLRIDNDYKQAKTRWNNTR